MMLRRFVLICCLFAVVGLLFTMRPADSAEPLWMPATLSARAAAGDDNPTEFLTYTLNQSELTPILAAAPMEFTASRINDDANIVSLPLPNGDLARFRVSVSPVMADRLAAKFPTIQTYSAQGVDDPSLTARFSVTSRGFEAIISKGSQTAFIAPVTPYEADTLYIAYDEAAIPMQDFQELVDQMETAEVNAGDGRMSIRSGTYAAGNQLRIFRMAIATTGELYQDKGGNDTDVLAFIVSRVNLVNGIYEHSFAARFQLVENNDQLLFDDPDTDPYQELSDLGEASAANAGVNQTTIDNIIGRANYDIGHLLMYRLGGGVVSGRVCDPTNSRALTNAVIPVSTFAHEIGHQFNLLHTWSACTVSLNGQYHASDAIEPGSGSTIMAYPGICGVNNVATARTVRFHAFSQQKFQQTVREGYAASCGITLNTDNTAPTVNAGSDISIPLDTPFILNGSATDGEGDTLTYTWDEFDLSPGTQITPGLDVAPFFMVYGETDEPTRTFPRLEAVRDGIQELGEYLPVSAQNMTFRLVAYDNRAGFGGTGYDEVVVSTITQTVGGASVTPFSVTSQNSAATWMAGASETITWNVGNSDQAPISCTNVNIDFATDGLLYSTSLATNTPNDGSETITAPNVTATTGRIRVSCASHSDHTFFALNSSSITLETTIPNYTDCAEDVVSSLADAGVCTLRDRVANATTGDTITFDPRIAGGSIILVESINIATAVTIDGTGRDIVIDGGGTTSRLLNLNTNDITLRGFTVANGAGDAIRSGESLTGLLLDKMMVRDNRSSSTDAGGLYNGPYTRLTIRDSLFHNNKGNGAGGVLVTESSVTVHSSTFTDNEAAGSSSYGGGIAIMDDGGIDVYNSTFVNNEAYNGGAIGGQTLLFTGSANVNVFNSTFYENIGRNGVDDIYFTWDEGFQAVLHLKNNIIAGDGTQLCGLGGDNAYIATNVNNLIQDGSCADGAVGLISADPQLQPLADNGGSTQTMAIAASSPARNTGDNATCMGAEVGGVDQRGTVRDANCDRGAFEQTDDSSDLYVTQEMTPSNPEPGDLITFTVTFGNSGIADAVNPTIEMPLNSNYLTNPTWSSSGHNVSLDSGTYQWSTDTLEPGDSGTLIVQATSNGAATFHNRVTITDAGDLNSANNSALVIVLSRSSTCSLIVSSNGRGNDADYSNGNNTIDEAAACAQAGDTVTFSGDMNIGFTTHLTPPADATIDGMMHNIIFDGGNTTRLIDSSNANSVLKNVTLQNGSATDGGAVYMRSGTLTLDNVTVQNNSATNGGAAYFLGGTLNIHNSLLKDNNASTGGAIRGYGGGQINLFGSTLQGNGATGDGGAIYTWTTMVISQSTIISSTTGNDGAIYNVGDPLTIVDATTIRNNTSTHRGGGIHNNVTLTLDDVTVQSNTSTDRGGGIYNTGTLTLDGVTVQSNGGSHGGGIYLGAGTSNITNSLLKDNNVATGDGGGIHSNGTVTLDAVTMENNSGGSGGAIFFQGGTLDVTNSLLKDNNASTGGAIRGYGGGLINLFNSTLQGNSATGDGGAVYAWTTTVISQSTVISSTTGDDGAIYTVGDPMTIVQSTIRNNTTTDRGGGIFHSGPLTIINSTISGNAAGSYGGAVESNGSLTIHNSTINRNSASTSIGGILSFNQLDISNTILANSSDGQDCVLSGGGTVSAAANNLIQATGGNACNIANGTDGNITGQNPRLRPLEDNGGQTETHRLEVGSPALGAGASCLATDQRGAARDAACDIGAFELQLTDPRTQRHENIPSGVMTQFDSADTELTWTGGTNPGNVAITKRANVTVPTGRVPLMWQIEADQEENLNVTLKFCYEQSDLPTDVAANEGNLVVYHRHTPADVFEQLVTTVDANANCVTVTVTRFSDFQLGLATPTAVKLASFTAQSDANGMVTIDWETEQEIDHAGFNLYRRAADSRAAWDQVNNNLIASYGLQGQGSTYQYQEVDVSSGSWEYLLEDVETDGDTYQHTNAIATVAIYAPSQVGFVNSGTTNMDASLLAITILLLALGLVAVTGYSVRQRRKSC